MAGEFGRAAVKLELHISLKKTLLSCSSEGCERSGLDSSNTSREVMMTLLMMGPHSL